MMKKTAMKEVSLESQAFTATKVKRRTRLDSYSKEMWAGGSCHIEKRFFLNFGWNSCVKFSCCPNTHYLAAEAPRCMVASARALRDLVLITKDNANDASESN
jgi:hypothetical protein